MKRHAELAKVEDLSCHDLRHRFGYRMAERVPLHRLAQLMDHEPSNVCELVHLLSFVSYLPLPLRTKHHRKGRIFHQLLTRWAQTG